MTREVYISIDDTDVEGGDGTGKLARRIARELDLVVNGITRHQLLIHPLIKYTKRNSCNVIIATIESRPSVFEDVKDIMTDAFQDGSDPGLAIAEKVPRTVLEFGRMAQLRVLRKEKALRVAREAGVGLEELGGSGDGVIGALAGIGLCASGEDGRYIMLDGLRELQGTVPVSKLECLGMEVIALGTGRRIQTGKVLLADRIRPSRVSGRPILFVNEGENAHYPVVL